MSGLTTVTGHERGWSTAFRRHHSSARAITRRSSLPSQDAKLILPIFWRRCPRRPGVSFNPMVVCATGAGICQPRRAPPE